MDARAGMALAAGIALVALFSGTAHAEPKKYTCQYCGEQFDTLAELQEHVRIVHPGERIPIEISWE